MFAGKIVADARKDPELILNKSYCQLPLKSGQSKSELLLFGSLIKATQKNDEKRQSI